MVQVVEREDRVVHRPEYRADFERVTGMTPSPAWLRQLRQRSFDQFEKLGFPSARLEEWRFTSVAPIAERSFRLAEDGTSRLTRDDVARLVVDGPSAAVLVCVNGRYAPQLSSTAALPAGVRVAGLASVLAADPDEVEPYLGRLATSDDRAFTALSTAFIRDGAFLTLPAHMVVEAPIYVLFLSTAADSEAIVTHPRVLVVAAEDSQAQILEHYATWTPGGTFATFTNAVTEISLGANARLDYYRLQQEGPDSLHVGTTWVGAGRGCSFSSHALSLQGALIRNEVTAVMGGEGGDCTLDGFYLGGGPGLIDNHTTIDHAKPHCTSREVYKGILGGQARAVFSGKIIVRPDAQKTDARQTNKALLLSDDAQINSKPQLEIFANDVKCTHGAAVGQLDEDALFYLRSRGLDAREARSLLIHAFAGDVAGRLKIPALRERLEAAIAEQLAASAAHN
jgi:Fe-S cluster assembly protein SufD